MYIVKEKEPLYAVQYDGNNEEECAALSDDIEIAANGRLAIPWYLENEHTRYINEGEWIVGRQEGLRVFNDAEFHSLFKIVKKSK